MALARRRNLLRIRPRPVHVHTEPHGTSFAMSEPAADDAKRYLAGLQQEESGHESHLGHSLSFDLTLTQWKSHSQLSETTPVEAVHRSRQILLFAEQADVIPFPLPALPLATLTPAPADPLSKRRTRKVFFNFNKNALSKKTLTKTKASGQSGDDSGSRPWLKQTLYTLKKDSPREQKKKPLRLNFTPKNEYKMEKSLSEWWPLHGIHQQRNKFQLILNSRKQKKGKMLHVSAMKPHEVINIFSRRLE